MSRFVCWMMMGCLAAGMLIPATASAREKDDELTVITSEKLTFDYRKQFALFENDVVVVDPEMKIFADTMLVLFNSENEVQSIKAEGKVRILQDDKQARSAVAEYHVATGEIILTGDPQVTRGKDTLTADVITFWRDEDRMECKPNARLVIFPDEGESRDPLFGK